MNKKQGRPIGSQVRQNIIEILYFYKRLHGYEIFKIYIELFPAVSMRLIYYHLKKGLDTNEFKIYKVERKQGNYSWGDDAENIIYELGPDANPLIQPHVKLHWEKHESQK